MKRTQPMFQVRMRSERPGFGLSEAVPSTAIGVVSAGLYSVAVRNRRSAAKAASAAAAMIIMVFRIFFIIGNASCMIWKI